MPAFIDYAIDYTLRLITPFHFQRHYAIDISPLTLMLSRKREKRKRKKRKRKRMPLFSQSWLCQMLAFRFIFAIIIFISLRH